VSVSLIATCFKYTPAKTFSEYDSKHVQCINVKYVNSQMNSHCVQFSQFNDQMNNAFDNLNNQQEQLVVNRSIHFCAVTFLDYPF
jgi:hypothetical protein